MTAIQLWRYPDVPEDLRVLIPDLDAPEWVAYIPPDVVDDPEVEKWLVEHLVTDESIPTQEVLQDGGRLYLFRQAVEEPEEQTERSVLSPKSGPLANGSPAK